jgi:hypothetical protein
VNELLAEVVEAHGGIDRWNRFNRLSATIAMDGAFRGLKSLTQDLDSRQLTVWLHQQRAMLEPFGDPDWHCDFSPARVEISSSDGTIVADRDLPRASFAGHDKLTPWDPLHLAYFEGYALWGYLCTPFLLAMQGVEVSEVVPLKEHDGTWRCLRAMFPEAVATHCIFQEFFFGDDRLLRRHDYRIDIAGGFEMAQLAFGYIDVGGIRLPAKRRVYARQPNRTLSPIPLMASIDISDIELS